MKKAFRPAPAAKLSLVVGLVVVLVACGGGGGGGGGSGIGGGGNVGPAEPAPTQVGTPVGSLSSLVIGAAGGSITSADGKAKLTVPAGALATDTTISIQPLTNNAHGGLGSAYRLLPEGQKFATPVQLSFPYTDSDLNGTAASALGVAFQRADGLWEWAGTPVVDTVAKTVSVATSHFSDWSLVEGFQIRPFTATVPTGKSLQLLVAFCYSSVPGNGVLAPLGYRCGPESGQLLAPMPPEVTVSEWSVNGVQGGNGTYGTISGYEASSTFVAPANVPNPATVTVSARVNQGSRGTALVLSNVTIVSNADYVGTLMFETSSVKGTANVVWNKFEDLGDTRRFLPSGSMTVDISQPGCDTLFNQQIPLETGSAANPGPDLVVYTGTNVAYPKQYQFVLSGSKSVNLTLQCGGSTMQYPASYISVIVGSCPGSSFLTYTDEKQLAGSFACPAIGLVSATWDFKAPN